MCDELKLLGKRIAKLRISKNLTQEKLAELVERTPNHISKLELAAANPSFEVLVKIAKALDVELSNLFKFEEKTDIKNIKSELRKLIDSEKKETLNLIYKIYNAIEN